MTKPNCTITERHDEMLNNIAEARYASRSEALRAAIEQSHQQLDESDESVPEQLISHIVEINNRLDELSSQIDDINEEATTDTHRRRTSEFTDARATHNDRVSESCRNKVYIALSDAEPMSIADIAEDVALTEVKVRKVVEELSEDGFVDCVARDGTEQYEIKPMSE